MFRVIIRKEKIALFHIYYKIFVNNNKGSRITFLRILGNHLERGDSSIQYLLQVFHY